VITRRVTSESAGSGECIRHGLIEIIDLEHDGMPIDIKRAKVVLFVRIVRVAKVIEHRDRLDDPSTASAPRAATRVL
jgi:hypothetical protein